jgi:hypothetical protein
VRLFKYVSPERVDILLNGHIRFTAAADFNDPFEIVPHLAAFWPSGHEDAYLKQLEPDARVMFEGALAEKLAALPLPPEVLAAGRELILQQFSSSKVIGLLKDMLPKIVELAKPKFVRHIREGLGERIGVLSLAESPTNLLMWAHYGACHRGFAIEFDAAHSFFNQTAPTMAIGRLMKVIYATDRPSIVAYDPTVPIETHTDRLIKDLLLTKGRDWAYEQEWRMILPLDDQASHPHEIDGRVHLFAVPSDAIKRVIVGARASDATKSGIRSALEASPKLADVAVLQARTSDTAYEISIDESA